MWSPQNNLIYRECPAPDVVGLKQKVLYSRICDGIQDCNGGGDEDGTLAPIDRQCQGGTQQFDLLSISTIFKSSTFSVLRIAYYDIFTSNSLFRLVYFDVCTLTFCQILHKTSKNLVERYGSKYSFGRSKVWPKKSK